MKTLDFNVDTPRLDSVQSTPSRHPAHYMGGGARHSTDYTGYEDHGFGENYSFPVLQYSPSSRMAQRLLRVLYS